GGGAAAGRDGAGGGWPVRPTSAWAGAKAMAYALLYHALGPTFIAMLTDQPALREAAAHYLPWVVAMPLLAVWSYQLDGIFIGSLRTRELRDGMILAFAAFLVAAFALPGACGNPGLWAALGVFFVMRALTLLAFLRRNPPRFAD